MSTSLTPADWIGLFTHFTALSLLAVGGVITTVPDMQRFVVREQGWITDAQFTASVALAQEKAARCSSGRSGQSSPMAATSAQPRPSAASTGWAAASLSEAP